MVQVHRVSEIWSQTGRQMGVKQNTEKWQHNKTCFRTNVFRYRKMNLFTKFILKLLTHCYAILLLSNSKTRRTASAFKCCLLCFWWHDYYEKSKLCLLYRSDDREVNSEWPVTAKSTGLFVVPTPCLPTHQNAWLSSFTKTVTISPL
jgi:hypothetical protein